MKRLILLLVFAGLIVPARRPARAADDVNWLLAQINALRAAQGVAPLALNPQLMTSSTGHSQYLATNPWRDPHVEANGSTPRSRIAAAGYPGAVIGENVYGGLMATAAIAYNWWLNEPLHYQGMVNPAFSEVGIGIANGPYGHFFTTDFGDRGGAVAPPPPVQNQQPVSQPRPTRRPASPIPSVTPSMTLTPSLTFTPLPSRTPTATNTTEPPTSTPIVLEVSPQPGMVLNTEPSFTPAAVAVLPSAPPSPVSTPTPPSAPLPSGNDPIRALLPFAIGLQVLILGGLALRRGRH